MNPKALQFFRFLLVALLIATTAIFVHALRGKEVIPHSERLNSFPLQVDDRTSQDVTIGSDVLQLLGPGDFLYRFYTRPDRPPIDFFLGYFPSQRAGNTPHSPKNCLPGSGWEPIESSEISFNADDNTRVTANRYIVQKGLDRELVIYWYQAHGRTVASEYWERFYLIADAIRMNRSDGAIVRVVTPILDNETESAADERVISFAKKAVPLLDPFIPR